MTSNGTIQDAKRAQAINLLDDLAAELDKGFLDSIVVVRGLKWELRLLQDHERNWVNSYTVSKNVLSMISSSKAPTLGIGIRRIGKNEPDAPMMTVEQFFVQLWQSEKAKLDPQV